LSRLNIKTRSSVNFECIYEFLVVDIV
jgi:hypothetical protein